jgi:hypothetical protein
MIFILFFVMESEKIRVVPADFEDKLLHHLQEKFIDDTNKEECQETIECLMEYIGSMFITMDYEGKKNVIGQVSAFTMFKRFGSGKNGHDWTTMSEDEKLEYRIMADEENLKRGSKNQGQVKKRASCKSVFKEEYPDGDWESLSYELKEVYKKKACQLNATNLASRGVTVPRKQSLEQRSYNVALKYARNKYSNEIFLTWSKISLQNKKLWSEFVCDKLYEDMNNDLYKELIMNEVDNNIKIFY